MNQRRSSRWRTILLSPVVGMLMANPALASDAAGGTDALVARAAAEFMAAPQAVGLSIGVLQAGVARSYHYGTVSKEAPRLPDDRTMYPIASLTKTFAAALLARAQLENKLKLDDDVRRHLGPGYANLAYEQQPVRLYHLLNHRSGLPFVLPDMPGTAPDAVVAAASREAFYAALRQVRLDAAPGSRFQYSNAAAQLLGYILEAVYQRSFETLVSEHIAAPLGMRDTVIVPSAEQAGRMVHGYDEAGVRQAYGPVEFQAAGALKSTLSDMMAYARWQLNEGDPAVLLSHQPTHASGEYAVGLNWQMLRAGKRRVIWQDGAVPGFGSLLVLHPDSGIAIVILVNELDRNSLAAMRKLANGIAGALDAASTPVP